MHHRKCDFRGFDNQTGSVGIDFPVFASSLVLASLIVDAYVSGNADTGALNMLDRNTVALPPPIEADQIAVIAKAMAHPARVRIIAFLLSKPGCIGGDIVDEVGLAQS
ncbi:MAG: ArsR/SmtB family transcription factor, partial [Pseudorhodobacter sp.]